jgi:hypothetical protein
MFHSWLAGTNPMSPSPLGNGNSSVFNSCEDFDLLGTTSRSSGITEFPLPLDLASDSLSEVIERDARQNVLSERRSPPNLVTLREPHPDQNSQSDEVCWFGNDSSWIEDTSLGSRQFIPTTFTDLEDPLSNWSRAVKQTSKLSLDSWQLLQGIISE